MVSMIRIESRPEAEECAVSDAVHDERIVAVPLIGSIPGTLKTRRNGRAFTRQVDRASCRFAQHNILSVALSPTGLEFCDWSYQAERRSFRLSGAPHRPGAPLTPPDLTDSSESKLAGWSPP